MRWTEQFKPDDWSEIVGNEESRKQFLQWLSKWSDERSKRAGLLYGPPGTGKTITVEIAARKLGYNLIELNASDVRTKDVLMEEIYPASRSLSLYSQRNLILLDEIDGLHQRQDTGGAAAVLKLIDGTNSPVVLTANDPWKASLREIRLKSQTFELKRLRRDSVIKRLRSIAKSQSLVVEDRALDRIAEKSHGDMRGAISDLEALASSGSVLDEETVSQILQDRTQGESIFEAIRGAMHSRSVQEARNHLSSTGLMVDDLVDWVYGNIENLVGDPDTLDVLAGAVADSDYLSALMRRGRTWAFIPYILDILSVGLMACGRSGPSWVKLQMPSKVSQRWARLAKEKERAAEAREIGEQLHERRAVVRSQVIPLLERVEVVPVPSVRSSTKTARPKRVRSTKSKARGR